MSEAMYLCEHAIIINEFDQEAQPFPAMRQLGCEIVVGPDNVRVYKDHRTVSAHCEGQSC